MTSALAPANGYSDFTSPQLYFNAVSLDELKKHLESKAIKIFMVHETTPPGPERDALANELSKLNHDALNVDLELRRVYREVLSRHGTPEWEENKEVWADYFDFVCMSIGEKAFIDLGGAPAVSEESE